MSELFLDVNLQGVQELIYRNRLFAKRAARTIKNSLQRTLRRTATQVSKDIRSRGIGRAIWEGKGGAGDIKRQKLITVIEPHAEGDSIVTGLKFRGVPRLIEEGGRTKAHPIVGGKGKHGLLIFEGRSGSFGGEGLVRKKRVQHPGGPVRRGGGGPGATRLRQNRGLIEQDLNDSIRKLVEGMYGA